MKPRNGLNQPQRRKRASMRLKPQAKKPESQPDPIHQREGRREEGRALRTDCPRSSHSKMGTRQRHRDPLGLIEQSNKGRIEELLPVRFSRMLESPFAFFRGSAIVQAHDLQGTPSAGIIVQSCGDCHLMNFGAFASPERLLIFDINDFDETLQAPFEWDLKRLTASFVLAARWRNFNRNQPRTIAVEAVRAYREQMAQFSRMSMLDVWYAHITVEDLMKAAGQRKESLKRINRVIGTARKNTVEVVFQKMTSEVEGRPRIIDQPPLLYHPDPTRFNTPAHVQLFVENYRDSLPPDRRLLFDRYQFVDVAFKVVGVGSVGTACFVSLWMADTDDPLFLQIKEARPSVLEGLTTKERYHHNGERVVVGQRIMQSASDIFLGWVTGAAGKNYYVRQLRDQKAAADVPTMTSRMLAGYARLCGKTLARAHAKSGEAAKISGYLGSSAKFDGVIADYAVAYADQVEKDFSLFKDAVRAGRFLTETSPSEAEVAIR